MNAPRIAIGVGTLVLVAIGIYDVAIGLVLLASATPWVAHGPGTSWMAMGASLGGGPLSDVTLGLFRRIGAFSLHSGAVTVVWAALGHAHPRVRTAQFVTYSLTGLAFGATDAAFFPGTAYLLAKRLIGVAFFGALVAHLVSGRKASGAASA